MDRRLLHALFRLLLHFAWVTVNCQGSLFSAKITEWTELPGSGTENMREVIMKNIRGIKDRRQEALDNLVCINEDYQSSRDHYLSRTESDITDNIFIYFIATAIAAAVLRHLNEYQKQKRLYMMKTDVWRDENGHRVAVAATISTKQKKNPNIRGIARPKSYNIITPDEKKGPSAKEGDLWLLLMNEEEPLAAAGHKMLQEKGKQNSDCYLVDNFIKRF